MTDVFGLVLAGGRSSRMGRDKAALTYHDVPQAAWMQRLLERCCGRAYVSARRGQRDDDDRTIFDRVDDLGPAGGLVAAHERFPHVAWLVVACDMPLVDEAALRRLIAARDPLHDAVCYEGPTGDLEPLCALYEPVSLAALARRVAQGDRSLRRCLEALGPRVARVAPASPSLVTNLNTPEELTAFLRPRAPRLEGSATPPSRRR